ncbi:MAG: hypothetical protein BAJALOKI1v1_1100013 [Promethearchaeota archaeon]|nr:MAG: hypothetical protein BAJALOKI1v1_1100013 [Candidatus Lokiarchaeota archaeon]
MKVKCVCQNLLDVELFWKGIFKIPEHNLEHQYYLFISHKCESCGETICIYRPRGSLISHLLIFMNNLVPEKTFKMTDIEMVSAWQDVFKKAAIKDIDGFQKIYSDEIIKFGQFIMKMRNKYDKK